MQTMRKWHVLIDSSCVYHLHLSYADHESSDLPPPAVRLEQPEHRLERAKRYSEEDRPQPNHNGGELK